MNKQIQNFLKKYARNNGYGSVSFSDMSNGLWYGANGSGLPLIQYSEGNSFFYDYGRDKQVNL
jgi:hypothetical protein